MADLPFLSCKRSCKHQYQLPATDSDLKSLSTCPLEKKFTFLLSRCCCVCYLLLLFSLKRQRNNFLLITPITYSSLPQRQKDLKQPLCKQEQHKSMCSILKHHSDCIYFLSHLLIFINQLLFLSPSYKLSIVCEFDIEKVIPLW